jgi:hypothetical protein
MSNNARGNEALLPAGSVLPVGPLSEISEETTINSYSDTPKSHLPKVRPNPQHAAYTDVRESASWMLFLITQFNKALAQRSATFQ